MHKLEPLLRQESKPEMEACMENKLELNNNNGLKEFAMSLGHNRL